MARSQSPGDFDVFLEEFEDIKSSKRHEEEDDDLAKTPDEGELEAAWLSNAGYSGIVNKFQAGKELSEDEIQAITESLPNNHAVVVRRRVDTLNATLRKKQKYTTKIDVRNIFPEQRAHSTTIIHSQPVGEDSQDSRQRAKRPSTLPRGLKLSSQNGESESWIKKQHYGSNSQSNSNILITDKGQGHSLRDFSDRYTYLGQLKDLGCEHENSLQESAVTDLITHCHICHEIQCEGHTKCRSKHHTRHLSRSKDSGSLELSMSSSCDTLDSIDSGLESSESLLNRENSTSHDSLDTVDGFRCFPKMGPFKYKLAISSPVGSPKQGISPAVENSYQVESPGSADEDSSPTLLGFRKRQHSVTELPKSPTSPDYVHSGRNLQRKSSSRGGSSFLKNRGGYSMSGTQDEVQDNLEMGVEMLSMLQKGRQPRSSTGSELSPLSDSEITFDFHIEESNGDDVLHEKSPSQTNLPNFSLVPDKLGLTCIDGISSVDVDQIRKLAFLELTSLFDTHQISYSRRRSKKKQKDHGIFGVPLTTLMEQDVKIHPQCTIPLVFQEIVSFLTKSCLESEGILRIPGSTSRVKQLRQEFEDRFYQGTFVWADDLTPNDVGMLMKQFLRELSVPLLTDEYIEAFAQVEYLPDKKSQLHALNLLILLLPDVHRDTLSVLLELLEQIIQHSNINKMSLSNVAMIMAPNLFMAPKVRGGNGAKSKASWELEIKMAANTSNIMRMLIFYRNIIWTVPNYLLALVRRQNELDQLNKNKDKSKMKGLLSKKDKSEVYKKPALKYEADFQDGVIRIQAPNLTKSSTAIQLDNHMTAGDIVSKFRVIQDADTVDNSNANLKTSNSSHGHVFVDHRNFHSAGDDTFLFEVGGNLGERCLPNDTNMAALYSVNPNAEWIIKRRKRFNVTS